MTKTAKALVCIVAGAVIGGAGGIGVGVAVGLYAQWQNPNDPSAGSVAIIGMATFPLGALIGIMAGALCADRWAKK